MAADFWSWAKGEINKISRAQGVSGAQAAKILQNNLNRASRATKSNADVSAARNAANAGAKSKPVRDALPKPSQKPMGRPASTKNAAAKSMTARADGYAASQTAKSKANYSAKSKGTGPTKYR